jgi:dGTP triphosphohydrolase
MTLEKLKEIVEKYTQVDIACEERNDEHCFARFAYCVLAKKYIKSNLKGIGKVINRDHTTVMHAQKNFNKYLRLSNNQDIYNIINNVILNIPKRTLDTGVKLRMLIADFAELADDIDKNPLPDLRDCLKVELRDSEKSILRDLKELSDSDVSELYLTRIKPYLSMLKTRVKHEVKETKGAKRKFSIN